jgi:hypothetical protein
VNNEAPRTAVLAICRVLLAASCQSAAAAIISTVRVDAELGLLPPIARCHPHGIHPGRRGTVPEGRRHTTDEQLNELYEQEKYRYQRFERVQLELAIWNRNPSQGDKDFARAQAEDLHKQLVEGADFVELAELNTMDPTGTASGGDLGWFGKGRWRRSKKRPSL